MKLNPRKRIVVPGRRDNGNGAQAYGLIVQYGFPIDGPRTAETGRILYTIVLNGQPVAFGNFGSLDEFMVKIGFKKEEQGPAEDGIGQ